MLYIHPVLMALAILLYAYVLYLGVARFRFNHLRQRVMFQWKRHVRLGQVAVVGYALGGGLGMLATWKEWSVVGGMGWHYHNFVYVILPLCVVSFATGAYMNRKKAPRTFLPLVHGLTNLALLLSGLCQVATGLPVAQSF